MAIFINHILFALGFTHSQLYEIPDRVWIAYERVDDNNNNSKQRAEQQQKSSWWFPFPLIAFNYMTIVMKLLADFSFFVRSNKKKSPCCCPVYVYTRTVHLSEYFDSEQFNLTATVITKTKRAKRNKPKLKRNLLLFTITWVDIVIVIVIVISKELKFDSTLYLSVSCSPFTNVALFSTHIIQIQFLRSSPPPHRIRILKPSTPNEEGNEQTNTDFFIPNNSQQFYVFIA